MITNTLRGCQKRMTIERVTHLCPHFDLQIGASFHACLYTEPLMHDHYEQKPSMITGLEKWFKLG